jgi:hypothetical protein
MSSITREDVLKMDLKSIHAAIKDPKTASDMQNLLRDRKVVSRVSELMLEAQNREAAVDAELNRTIPPSTEALAAEATELAATPEAVPVVVEPVVEAPPVVAPEVPAERKKIVREYQVRDEDGTPIGRPTHLEAWSIEEMMEKMQTAHENATRAFHRLKKQKITFKQDRTILSPEEIAEAARVALESKDSSKITDVISEVIESKYKQRETELKKKQDFEEGRQISNDFMRQHLHDYNPCEANQKAIGEYFAEHKLDFTRDNLEAAFQDLKEQGDKLAPVENTGATRQATVAANPAPVATPATPAPPAIPVAETPAVVPASAPPAQPPAPSQPVVEATAPTPVAAPNVQPAARRPGVNGSLPPGTLSAQRPGAPDPALARKEFLKTVKDMKPEVMKAKLKSDPQFVKQLESYGIRIR